MTHLDMILIGITLYRKDTIYVETCLPYHQIQPLLLCKLSQVYLPEGMRLQYLYFTFPFY